MGLGALRALVEDGQVSKGAALPAHILMHWWVLAF